MLKIRAKTQLAAAKACGIPYDTFRGWMHKNIFPPLVDAYKLSRYLGVSVEYFLNGKDPGKAEQSNEQSFIKMKKRESGE